MIKWFCDVCGNEILAPKHPVRVKAYRCGKNRDGVDTGWGGSDDIVSVFCHEECADVLETEIKGALDAAKRVAANNA